MKIIGPQKFSTLMYVASLTITSIAFGSLFATPQILFAQGEANETFFEASVREAGQTQQQQNQTGGATAAAAPAPAPARPSSTEQQNQTEAAPAPAPAPPSSTEQQNQTEAAPAPAPPSSTEQQNQTQSQNPFEQLGQAISRLFGGN
jgi:hypothetical protein